MGWSIRKPFEGISGGQALLGGSLLSNPTSLYGGLAGAAASGGANLYMAHETNRQARLNSNKQMDFQRDMSNSAHQREVADLKKAGLNPNLSAGGNGSSTPSGAQPSLQAPQLNLPDFMSYGIQLKQLEQVDQRIAIDRANSAAGIASKDAGIDLTKMKTLLSRKGMPRAELEGEATQWLQKAINYLKSGQLTKPSNTTAYPRR